MAGGGGSDARTGEVMNNSAASLLELQTNLREYFTITEKAPTRAFSWLKVPTNAFTFKTLCKTGATTW